MYKTFIKIIMEKLPQNIKDILISLVEESIRKEENYILSYRSIPSLVELNKIKVKELILCKEFLNQIEC